MNRVGRWWGGLSATERFDLSSRASMYLLLGVPLFISVSAIGAPAEGQRVRVWAAVALVAVGLAHLTVSALIVRASLARVLGTPARLAPLCTAGLALTVAGAALGWQVLTGPAEGGSAPLGMILGTAFAGILAGAASPALSIPVLAGIVAGTIALSALVGRVVEDGAAAGQGAIFAFFWVGCMTATYKFSAWMIGVVWELDRGRAAAARLAVAEERLRFSRDLHDVVGRSFSVIAVKSELAGRLAERGEPGAAAEMHEVRRMAHDALKEVRDVVRGYRTADLEAELAGARSVLRSAGVECRVIGDGTHLPPDVQTALGWVVREATTNVIRHSDATTCTIGLDVRDAGGTAVLRMENDRARDAAAADAGVGLAGLAERLAGLGGRLSAGRRPGDLFVVEAFVPVATP